MLQLDASLQCDCLPAVKFLEQSPWLLIPDLSEKLFQDGRQQVFCRHDLPEGLDADFLVTERRPEGTHWQLVCLAAPNARILYEGRLSPEFHDALARVDRWSTMQPDSFPTLFGNTFEGEIRSFSYRIVIGDSDRQSAEERAIVRSCRTKNLRIRSYRWILEKQQRCCSVEWRSFSGGLIPFPHA